MGGNNKNLSFKTHIERELETNSFNCFIGIVDSVKYPEDENLEIFDEEFELDDRYLVTVRPIDSKNAQLVECFLMNNHDLDLPVQGEAVFVFSNSAMNIIYDRFSPYAFGVNKSYSSYLTTSNLTYLPTPVEDQDSNPEEDEFLKQTVTSVKPWTLPRGSKAYLGRNNQYLIFSSANFREATSETNDVIMVRSGIRNEGDDSFSSDDPIFHLMGKNINAYDIFNTFDVEMETEDIHTKHGFSADEILFQGKHLIVLYSFKNIIIKSNRIDILGTERVKVDAERIELGLEPTEPSVLGNKAVEMLDEVIGLFEAMECLTPAGPSKGITPTFKTRLNQFKLKYNKKNTSPIHSRKTFIE